MRKIFVSINGFKLRTQLIKLKSNDNVKILNSVVSVTGNKEDTSNVTF